MYGMLYKDFLNHQSGKKIKKRVLKYLDQTKDRSKRSGKVAEPSTRDTVVSYPESPIQILKNL